MPDPLPFTQSSSEVVSELTGDVSRRAEKLAVLQSGTATHVKPVQWKALAAKLFSSATSITQIAEMLQQPYQDVEAFLMSEDGRQAVYAQLTGSEVQINRLLESSKIDTIYTLMRLRASLLNPTACLGACKQLLDLHGEATRRLRDPAEVLNELKRRQAEIQSKQTNEQS